MISQRHPDKSYPLLWECTGGSVLASENSLDGAIREVKEELGIALNPADGQIIYQICRENTQDFYDVWLFRADIDISKVILQETEVVGVRLVNRDSLLDMYQKGELHPLLDYIEQIM